MGQDKNSSTFGANVIGTDITQRVRPLPGEDVEEIRSEQAALRADEVSLVRSRQASSATGHLSAAAAALVNSPTERLSDSAYKTFRERVTYAVRLSEQDRQLARVEKELRSQVRVVGERDPYAKGSPHSWVRDVVAESSDGSALGMRADVGHEERLRRSAALAQRAVERRNRYGKQILAQLREGYRGKDENLNRQLADQAEQRALTTGGGATASAAGGGAAPFVAPSILMAAWAQYRSPYAAFIGQCDNSTPLPDYGLTVYIPVVTTGTTVATDVEGSGTAEGDPVTSFASSAVVQKAGQITVSQAMLDRVGPGISGDVFLWTQLKNQLTQQVNL